MPAIPPSGPSSAQSQAPGDQPGWMLGLFFEAMIGNSDPIKNKIGTDLSAIIQKLPNDDLPTVENAIMSYLQCPDPLQHPGEDALMYYAQIGLGNAAADLGEDHGVLWGCNWVLQHNFGITWQPPLPHTAMDDIYMNLAGWQSPSDVAGLYNSICSQISGHMGSSGSVTGDLFPYIQGILSDPNFFTNYPNMNGQDLTTLLQLCAVSVPPYLSSFLALGYKTSRTPLEQDLLQEMGKVFAESNAEALVQQWFGDTIGNPANYNLSQSDITTLAADMGVTLNATFFTYFNAMKALLPSDPSSADYKMIVDFQGQWITGFISQSNFQTWFTNTFGAAGQVYPPGSTSLYMLYPLADQAMIQSVAKIFISGSYTPSAWDTIYRTLYAAHGSDSSGLYYDFFAVCRAIGSGDNNQGIEQWLDNQALTGFPQYSTTPAGISNIIDFLNDLPFTVTFGTNTYCYICDFIMGYIQEIWLKDPSRTLADKQFGLTLVADISSSGPFSSFAALKAFIDGRVPAYQRLDPGGTPPGSTVTNFLEMFELYIPPQGE